MVVESLQQKWLAEQDSNPPHFRLTAGRAHPECYLPINLPDGVTSIA
jgi:hypothetical protein